MSEPSRPVIVVFGGSGFLGSRVVERLLSQGFHVRIASRHPRQRTRDGLTSVEADVRDDDGIAVAVEGAWGAVNAVSLYVERGGQTFQSVHVEAAERVARHAASAGLTRLCHVSGIGSDPTSASRYIASRGRGEAVVRAAFPGATLVRPAVMFGPDDALVVPVSRLLRRLPAFALFGHGRTNLQPVHVDDVAAAMARTFNLSPPAPRYELAGPHVYSYREFIEMLRRETGSRTLLLPLPFWAWKGLATVAERLPRPPITRNQIELMREDNIASGTAPGFSVLDIVPRTLEASLKEILPRR